MRYKPEDLYMEKLRNDLKDVIYEKITFTNVAKNCLFKTIIEYNSKVKDYNKIENASDKQIIILAKKYYINLLEYVKK